ncbi:hypothetical protein [Methylobacterium brachythecii]|uniref:Uncharacterized protein n=1 Tax=Methylobacterium brachythecii TaxID=1176177 RepID=A0A7W6AED2_9HYPH|nr:hypothetical protein [Methylobacterium brachythecii]MBB3901748.1 hypothetical protein [Methylobacterium brachythecii]GLS43895.1 hypothetical protein GCM10007884_18810 [Methylobacterium brachythecii]
MTQVLLIGYAPDAVDYSDPALPPGMDAEKIAAGIEVGLKDMRDRGWGADFCSIRPDDAVATVTQQLKAHTYDCVVIGGGVRLASNGLIVFEAVINTVRQHAPAAAIAFNSRPENTAEAAARWIEAG